MIPAFITNRIWVKLGSVLLAVVVWSYISSNISNDGWFKVPLGIKLSEGMMIVDGGSQQIEILTRGPSDVIKETLPVDFTVTCDLSGQTAPGKVTKDISRTNMEGPPDVRIINYSPKEVTFNLDRIVEKVLSVKVVTLGAPQEGYRIEATSPNPSSVIVTGAESLLKVKEVVETVPEDADVTGLNWRKTFGRVRLQPIGGMVPDTTVNVSVKVGRELSQKKYDKVPIMVISPATSGIDVAVSPQEVEIVLAGLKERLDKLKSSDIIVYVDVAGLKPARYELPLKAKLPEGINMREAVPATCEVVVKSKSEMVPEADMEHLGNL